MTNYEIRVTQVTRDYYRLEAKDVKDAEAQLWTALRTGIMGNIALNDTNDNAPTIDYTVQLSDEGEVII
tara:strand:+ start:414 stop:620 length:207 start_codon:yes stop_codon:yes gene_type:complete